MRPRFMNRGSARFSPDSPVLIWRFNEAPIHESGKSKSLADAKRIVCELQ